MSKKNKEYPLVSVIIPIYNVERYLGKCLDSIINNTYKNLEIICVNDGSPDGSSFILSKYAQEDPRIVVINQENQGVSMARNNGLRESHGDYIAFVDSDDYIHKQYFETMMNCMLKTDADVVICNALKVNFSDCVEDDVYSHFRYKKLKAKDFFKSYYARHMIWARIYKKSFLKNHSFSTEVRTGDDTLFNLELMRTAIKPIVYETDKPLYYYMQRDDSIVHSSNYTRLKDISDYYLKRIMGTRCDDDDWGWVLLMQAIKSMLAYRYMIRFRPDATILKKEANKALYLHLKEMMSYNGISVLEKAKHWIMYFFPELYRRFRIYNDPTMLEWEKNEKNLY